ncbi:MAG: YihY/virulence factor BrkB family protein [Actinomycetota bacterium]
MINIRKISIITIRYLKRLLSKFISDGGPFLSSSIAYYFLFSIFPLMLILLSFSAFLIETLRIQAPILSFIQERIPIIYNFTESNIERTIQSRTSIGIVGVLFLIIATTYVFDSVQYALNKIYKTKQQRKFWKQKIFGFLIISLVFFLISLSIISSTVLFYLANYLIDFFHISEEVSSRLIKALSLGIGLSFNFAIFSLIFYFGTNRPTHFAYIYKGALVGALGWEASKHIFVFFLNNFANFEFTYGSVGSIIGFLFWVYISSTILLIGAEINSLGIE